MADPASNKPASEPSKLEDDELITRAQQGDREAFGGLVRRYQDRTYRLALRVLRDEDQARDVTQEAFLKAYRSLGSFQGRSRFYTWMYRLTMNLCIDAKRRDKGDRHVEWEDERSYSSGDEGASAASFSGGPPDPLAEVARVELGGVIAKAMEQLPDDARRTLELREIDGLGYAEIAKALGIPKGTVMSRLHYARKRMRAMGFEKDLVREVSQLVFLSGRFKGYADGWSDAAVRRYARDAGPLLGDLNDLVRSDCTSRNPRRVAALHASLDELEARIADLARDDARKAERAEIDGAAVMEHLGIEPGPDVGAAMKFLLELKRTEGVLGTDEVLARLDDWWANRQA